MKTEIEFLEQIKNEFATAEYGEGRSFNLNGIVDTINDRIRQMKNAQPKQGEAELLKSLKEAEYLLSGEPSEENAYEAHNIIEEIINNIELPNPPVT